MRPLQILHPLLVVALGSLAVCENIDSLASPPALPPASKPYTLNLSCAQCAFTYGDCVNSVQLPSFLVCFPLLNTLNPTNQPDHHILYAK